MGRLNSGNLNKKMHPYEKPYTILDNNSKIVKQKLYSC